LCHFGTTEILGGIKVNFLRNVVKEMKKVTWPTRKELGRYTITVLSTVAFVSVFFWVIDVGLNYLMTFIYE
jgi:preprotein translocase subunit SecE